ncbi:unnamed protein product [Effrenium voratum]|nr:unnamed protein product [Effrenium voratum]
MVGRCQEELRTFMQCLMLPPPPGPSSKPQSKSCRSLPRAHLRLDLPFDQALQELTARLAIEGKVAPSPSMAPKPPPPASPSGSFGGSALEAKRRPGSSSQARPRGGPVQKRARSTGRLPISKRGVPEGRLLNNPFGQWPHTPPKLYGTPGAGLSASQPLREAWSSQEEVPEGAPSAEAADGTPDVDELQRLDSRQSKRSSSRGRSKPRSESRGCSKRILDGASGSRRGSDYSDRASGFSRRGSKNSASKRSSASFFGEDMPVTKGDAWQAAQVQEVPNRAKDFGEQSLSETIGLPLEVVKQAAECYKNHVVDLEPRDRPDLWRLKQSDFQKVLCELCSVKDVSELPSSFVSKAFHLADMTRSNDLDLQEFVTWYATFSFSEELLLGKSTKSIRDVARRLGINLLDIERYKRVFDSFDQDKSGVIEMPEFRMMLHRLLKVPNGHHLPVSQVKSFWNMADSDGNGKIDFPEFCEFYLRVFSRPGEDFQLSDMYSIRKVSVKRSV